tara:strand:- start:365 stop:1819 length:1455 start_codon:yes stop_codon:yes gene_type:complete
MKAILFTTLLIITATGFAQTQMGDNINGEAAVDRSGYSVSLSSDGSVVAIGAPNNDGNGSNAGHVRVYQYSNNEWTQMGYDIDGEAKDDWSGHSVALSSDGLIVAIGARYNSGGAGHARIYKYSNSEWTQMGSDIDGEASGDWSGYSVSLSDDGNIVAVGAINNRDSEYQSGHVRVYQFSSNAWSQLGSDIDGEDISDQSGFSVSLSFDGSTVAIGAPSNDEHSYGAGHVRVYGYSNSQWTQMGSDIDGKGGDQSGRSVSLSSDGTIVAIGAVLSSRNGNNSGHVGVYQYSNNEWTQIGSDINGNAHELSGRSVSLSSDGTVVAIGAISDDGEKNATEHVRLYQYSDTTWTQIGADLVSDSAEDLTGHSVSLSSDGKVLALGAILSDVNGASAGQVRVYSIDNILLSVEDVKNRGVLPRNTFANPTSGIINCTWKSSEEIIVINSLGQSVPFDKRENGIDISNAHDGIYFVLLSGHWHKVIKEH